MQVFKAFFKTGKKFLPVICMYFIIFSIIAFMATHFNLSSKDSAFQSTSLDIGIIDKDHSDASKAVWDYLSGLHTLTPLSYDKEILLDRLFYRNSDYILILPEGFEANLLSGDTDTLFETVQIPGIYSSAFIDEQINAFLKTVKIYLVGGFPLDEALEHTKDTLLDSLNQVNVITSDKGDEKSSSTTAIYYYYQFLPYVLLSMILCGLTPILTIFWEKNISKRMSCSSTSLLSRNFQLALGSILYCLSIWLLFVLTSRIFYGAEMFSKTGLLCIANSFFILPLGVSISLIIGCFTPKGNTINMINNVVSLGMSFLCGIFVPQQMLGDQVLSFSKYLPFYWYIKNNNLISGFTEEKFEMNTYFKQLGIQFLFCIAIFAAALVITKYKSTKQKE